jgi:hypothetical protein
LLFDLRYLVLRQWVISWSRFANILIYLILGAELELRIVFVYYLVFRVYERAIGLIILVLILFGIMGMIIIIYLY